MAVCEECWIEAFAIAYRTGRPQAEVYHELIDASPDHCLVGGSDD